MLMGNSTRVSDKPFIKIGGKPLFRYGYDILEDIFEKPLIVANESVAQKVQKIGLDFVLENMDIGPVGGIIAGLKTLTSKYVFVTACDMPFINEKVVRYMQTLVSDDGLFPKHDNGNIESLHGFYNRGSFIKAEIPKDYKIRNMIEEMNVSYVQTGELRRLDPELSTFKNINTREDIRWFQGLI